jgi:hypothetical protein
VGRHTGFWWGKPKQRNKFFKNGQMILKLTFKKQYWRAWTGLNWLKLRIVSSYEQCKELPDTVKFGEFLHWLRNH